MKFDRNKTFPYPVLRPFSDDYIGCEFQHLVDFQYAEGSVNISISWRVSSPELIKQIELDNARYVSIVSCRGTYFRRVLSSPQKTASLTVDVGDLRGEVRVDSYIVAVQRINEFSSPDINPEFGRDTFLFTPGDVLAQEETSIHYIDREMFRPVTSVFDLVKNDSLLHGEWRVSAEDEHVQIEVSATMKEVIDNARNNTAHKVVLLNSLYFSAVVHAIQKLKDFAVDYEERKWSRVISQQLHNAGLDLTTNDAYILAQKLMKQPLGVLHHYVLKGSE